MSTDGAPLAGPGKAAPRAATAGAVVCAGVAVLLVVATALVTYGLAGSYGFGPFWDLSAIVMTGAVAAVVGGALLGASRLARLRMKALPVLAAAVASVFVIGYVAGVLGNRTYH